MLRSLLPFDTGTSTRVVPTIPYAELASSRYEETPQVRIVLRGARPLRRGNPAFRLADRLHNSEPGLFFVPMTLPDLKPSKKPAPPQPAQSGSPKQHRYSDSRPPSCRRRVFSTHEHLASSCCPTRRGCRPNVPRQNASYYQMHNV